MAKKKENLREGRYCLKFGKWTSEVVEDGLCESRGDPQCRDCLYQAWNIIKDGLPIDGMPIIFYLSNEWELTDRIKECRHGNLFLKWEGPLSLCNKGWIKFVDDSWIIGSECNCKSPK